MAGPRTPAEGSPQQELFDVTSTWYCHVLDVLLDPRESVAADL